MLYICFFCARLVFLIVIMSGAGLAPLAAEQPLAVADIDQEIQKLKDKKKRLQEQRTVAEDQADQLLSLDWFGYREAEDKEAYLEQHIQLLDQQIEELEQKKQKLASQSS
jgi:hypothetical protein